MALWSLAVVPQPAGGAIDLASDPAGDDDGTALGWGVFKMQYMGTWSHTDAADKKAPESMSKHDFGELVMTKAGVLFRASQNARRVRLNRLAKIAVFGEAHVSGKRHYHFSVLADKPWSPIPLQRALRTERIFVEFSTTHEYYWTTFIYLSVPGSNPGDKKEEDIDQDPWLSPGHPTVMDTIKDIPRGARACDKARVRRHLSINSEGANVGKKDVALTDKEFASHIVEKSLHDVIQVQAWVASMMDLMKRVNNPVPLDHRATAIGMEAYMYKNQGDLAKRIAFAWQVAGAPKTISMRTKSAWDMFIAAGDAAQCTCGGRWIPLTESLLKYQVQNFPKNGLKDEMPHSVEVRSAITTALVLARHWEKTN